MRYINWICTVLVDNLSVIFITFCIAIIIIWHAFFSFSLLPTFVSTISSFIAIMVSLPIIIQKYYRATGKILTIKKIIIIKNTQKNNFTWKLFINNNLLTPVNINKIFIDAEKSYKVIKYPKEPPQQYSMIPEHSSLSNENFILAANSRSKIKVIKDIQNLENIKKAKTISLSIETNECSLELKCKNIILLNMEGENQTPDFEEEYSCQYKAKCKFLCLWVSYHLRCIKKMCKKDK